MNNDLARNNNNLNQNKTSVRRVPLVATRRSGNHNSGNVKIKMDELNPVVPLRKYEALSLRARKLLETLSKKFSRPTPKHEESAVTRAKVREYECYLDQMNANDLKVAGTERREFGVQTSNSIATLKNDDTPTTHLDKEPNSSISYGGPSENLVDTMASYDLATDLAESSECDNDRCGCSSCASRDYASEGDTTNDSSPAIDLQNLCHECGCGTDNLYSYWASQIPPIPHPRFIPCPLVPFPCSSPNGYLHSGHCQMCEADGAIPDITITSQGKFIVHSLFPLPTDGSYQRYYISGFDVSVHEYYMTSRNTHKRIRLDFYSVGFADPDSFEAEVEDNGNIVISGNIFGSLSRLWVFVESLKTPDNVNVQNPTMYYYTVEIPISV